MYSYQADKKDLNIFYLDAKSDGDGKISYRSENEKIVKIDADGIVIPYNQMEVYVHPRK